MLGRLRIRGKLALVVGLPLLAVALLTLPSVFAAVDQFRRAEEIDRSMQVANRVTALAFELQQERLLSIAYLFDVVDRRQLAAEAAKVDDRIVEIHYAVAHGELREQGLAEPVSAAVTAAENLVQGRGSVLDRSVEADQVYFEYTGVIGQLLASLRLLDGVDMATPVAHHVAVLDASLGMNEASAQASTLLLMVASGQSEFAGIGYAMSLAPMGDYLDQYLRYGTPDQLLLRDEMELAYIERDATGEGIALGLNPFEVAAGQTAADLFPHVQSLSQLGRFVEGVITTDVMIEVAAQRESALRNAYLIAIGALLVVLVVVGTTAALTRRVVRPLLGLTDSANRVASVVDAELARITDDDSMLMLREPIRINKVHVRARDEIGDLGRAFERVQAFAIQLVERQMVSRRNVALMFGYLGRRTQSLVARQLDLIDELERNETDTQRLRGLYQLDHVSSRLRRNAGSLVVLSGSTAPDDYTTPLPLADIVRLALGEIEEYQRVDVDVAPTIEVAPGAIGALILILAELMENATRFSPPHTRVTVSGTVTGHHGNGDHVVEVLVVDNGIGIPPDRLAEENARLARRERLDLAPTEVLGLFVVGRLARRHGMRITLLDTAGGGVTAAVALYREHVVPSETGRGVISARGTGEQANPDQPAGQPPPSPGERLLAQALPAGQELGSRGVELLDRAARALEAGQPWNAFAAPAPATAAPPDVPAPDEVTPDLAPDLAPAQPPQPGPPPQQAPAAPPRSGQLPPVTAAGPTRGLGLRQRVPGATLASPTPLARPQPSPAADGRPPGHPRAFDPALAREMMEQLQTGVTRALSEIQSRSGRNGQEPVVDPSSHERDDGGPVS